MLRTFAYHKPGPGGLKKITELREAFSEMKELIEEVCPQSRERSVALTELETTAMWAVKAVVVNDPESEPEGMRKTYEEQTPEEKDAAQKEALGQ